MSRPISPIQYLQEQTRLTPLFASSASAGNALGDAGFNDLSDATKWIKEHSSDWQYINGYYANSVQVPAIGAYVNSGGTITEVSGQTLTVAHEISQGTTNAELVITFKLGPIGTVGNHSITVTLFWGGNTQTIGTFNNASYGSTEQTIHFFPAISPLLVPATGVQLASLRIVEAIASPRTGVSGSVGDYTGMKCAMFRTFGRC